MKNDLKFRLIYTRGKLKNIMLPEFRTIIDIPEDILLKGTYEVTGSKQSNGNIEISFNSFYETEQERELRLKKSPPRPLSEGKNRK